MKKILLLSIVFSLVSFTILNQTSFFKKIQEKLDNYAENHPEKIYIHTDKPFYSVDDDLWFTTYLIDGINHQKTDKSKVVHVELINENDSIVSTRKLYILNTVASGDFKIDEDWKPGNYILRAYTKYMLNESSNYFFQKEISIYDVKTKTVEISTNKIVDAKIEASRKGNNDFINSKPNLSFYPEGGNLITGIPNKVAFEIKDNNYTEINLTGTIKDSKGNEILDFKTIQLGLGSFVLIPEKDENYYASIQVNGKEIKYNLPKALNKGYTLNVNNSGEHIIISSVSNLKDGLKGSYIVAHQRGDLLYKNFEKTNTKKNTIKISTKELTDGVANITLFNREGNPVSERLIFIDNPKNNLKLNIINPTKTSEVSKKITLNLNVKDINNKNIESSLSMAVRDLKAYPHNTKSGNIKSWLLLNSDLKGSIKNPGYFFEKENDSKRRYVLDLLMMTHGWRRFTWTEILNNKTILEPKIEPEVGLYLSGTTQQLKKPYKAFSAPTRLTFMGKNIFHQEPIKKSDTLGHFKFGPYVFLDSMPVIIESRMDNFKSTKRKSRNVVILVDKDNNSPKIDRNTFFNKIEKENKTLEIANFIKVTQYIKEEQFKYNQKLEKLNEITLIAKRKTTLQKRREEMNDLTDYGTPITGQRLDLLNDFTEAGSYSAFDIVSTMTGVNVLGDSIFLRRANNSAKIVLDNLEVDGSFLRSINGDEISFIDILTGGDAATFSNAANGVIALYSNSGDVGSRNITRKPGIIDFQAKGFYTARKFYAPDPSDVFNDPDQSDLRTTLHWEPIIKTSNNGNTEISFYTSEITSDYIIEVEGISDKGIPIHGIETFNVE